MIVSHWLLADEPEDRSSMEQMFQAAHGIGDVMGDLASPGPAYASGALLTFDKPHLTNTVERSFTNAVNSCEKSKISQTFYEGLKKHGLARVRGRRPLTFDFHPETLFSGHLPKAL